MYFSLYNTNYNFLMVKKYNRLNQICPSSGQTLYPIKRKKIKVLPCPLRPKQPAACSCAPCLWNSVPLVQVSAPPWSLHCSYNKRTIGWSQWACCCLHLQLSPRHQPSPLPQASQAPAKCSPPEQSSLLSRQNVTPQKPVVLCSQHSPLPGR